MTTIISASSSVGAKIIAPFKRAWAWLKAKVSRRPEATEGQLDQERETAASLRLMHEAQAAGADMTDEQAIFLSQSKAGMRARVSRLLQIPDRSLAQERELVMIERELARLEGRDAPAPPTRVRAFVGVAAAHPAIAILLSPWTWLTGLALFCGFQMLLKERIEDQRDAARREVQALEAGRDAYARALAAERAARAQDVAAVLEQTAETVEQMQRQAARRAARERRERTRREDLDRGSVDFTERLRELAQPDDTRLPADPAAPPGSNSSGAVSVAPLANAADGDNP